MKYEKLELKQEKIKFEPNTPKAFTFMDMDYKTLNGDYGEYYAISVRDETEPGSDNKLLTTSSIILKRAFDVLKERDGSLAGKTLRVTLKQDGLKTQYEVEEGTQ